MCTCICDNNIMITSLKYIIINILFLKKSLVGYLFLIFTKMHLLFVLKITVNHITFSLMQSALLCRTIFILHFGFKSVHMCISTYMYQYHIVNRIQDI